MSGSLLRSAFRILAGTTAGVAVLSFLGSKVLPEPAKPQVQLSAQVKAEIAREQVDVSRLSQSAVQPTLRAQPVTTVAPSPTELAKKIEQQSLDNANFRAAYGDWKTAPTELMTAQFKSLALRFIAAPPGLEGYQLFDQLSDLSTGLTHRAQEDEQKKAGRPLKIAEINESIARESSRMEAALAELKITPNQLENVAKQLMGTSTAMSQTLLAHITTGAATRQATLLTNSLLSNDLRQEIFSRGFLIMTEDNRAVPSSALSTDVSRELYGRINGYAGPAPVKLSPAQLTETLTLLQGPWGDIWQKNLKDMGLTPDKMNLFNERVRNDLRERIEGPAESAAPASARASAPRPS
jgi:hypothetical protein